MRDRPTTPRTDALEFPATLDNGARAMVTSASFSREIEQHLDAWSKAATACEILRVKAERQRDELTELVAKWRDMTPEELRLRAGDMTAQEIRSVKAVLNAILPNAKCAATGSERNDHE